MDNITMPEAFTTRRGRGKLSLLLTVGQPCSLVALRNASTASELDMMKVLGSYLEKFNYW